MNARMIRFGEAFHLANQLHAAQLRKDTKIPYISHLMSVAALVMEYGGTPEQAEAALLHDAIEDADDADDASRRRALILERFGNQVAAIVEGCTDGAPDASGVKPEWKPRKEAYLRHLADAPADVLLVSCADKLHNARAILADLRKSDSSVFTRFNAGQEGTLWYYSQLAATFNNVLGGPLAAELSRTVDALLAEAA